MKKSSRATDSCMERMQKLASLHAWGFVSTSDIRPGHASPASYVLLGIEGAPDHLIVLFHLALVRKRREFGECHTPKLNWPQSPIRPQSLSKIKIIKLTIDFIYWALWGQAMISAFHAIFISSMQQLYDVWSWGVWNCNYLTCFDLSPQNDNFMFQLNRCHNSCF